MRCRYLDGPLRELQRLAGTIIEPSSLRLDRVILAVALAGGLALVAADVFQRWIAPEHIWALDIDGRFNAVTWFHSFVLAGAALAALGLASTYRDSGQRLMWLLAGGAMAFLSLDKSISLHERVGESIEQRFDLPEQAGRVIWEAVYAPFLIALVILLIIAVGRASTPARLWVGFGIALCAGKVALEALMFPAIHLELFDETSVLYGIEVNIEESVQLLGFAAFFGAFAQLLFDRISLMAQGRLESADAEAVERPLLDFPRLTKREWPKAV